MNISSMHNLVQNSSSGLWVAGTALVVTSAVGFLAHRCFRKLPSKQLCVPAESFNIHDNPLWNTLSLEQAKRIDLIEALAATALKTPDWYCYEGAFRVPGNGKNVGTVNNAFQTKPASQWQGYINELVADCTYNDAMLSVLKFQVKQTGIDRVHIETLAPSLHALIDAVVAHCDETKMTKEAMSIAFPDHIMTDEEASAFMPMSHMKVSPQQALPLKEQWSASSQPSLSHVSQSKKGSFARFKTFFSNKGKKDG